MKTAALIAFCAATAAAVDRADWANVTQLPAGSEIRVTLANRKTLRGFLQTAAADSLQINATTSQETIARLDIKRVRLKRPGHRGRNTLIGLGIGAAGGLTTGALIDRASNGDLLENIGKLALTPMGALIGTVIGVAIPTGGWREVYRSR